MNASEAFQEAESRIAAWRPGETLNLAIPDLVKLADSIKQLSPPRTLKELIKYGVEVD